MIVEFNAKFFFIAVILSIVAGVFQNLAMWLHLYRLGPSLYSWVVLGLAPVRLVFGVALPFAVMCILSTEVSLESVKSIMVATFLGCWIGGVTIFAFNIFITYLGGSSYGYDSILQTTLWIIWTIFATAFSSIFFVSLAAILFAYYQKQLTKHA
jgi:hypothetical protein